MQKVIDGINQWISRIPEEFNRMSERQVSEYPHPNKWSKKEVLGHLCDSALNNLERFIKIQYEEQPYMIQPYDQEQWVKVQQYQETALEEIINLYCTLNNQIITIIRTVPTEKLSYQCDIGKGQKETLEWLIKDYLEHMEHHIKNQILLK